MFEWIHYKDRSKTTTEDIKDCKWVKAYLKPCLQVTARGPNPAHEAISSGCKDIL